MKLHLQSCEKEVLELVKQNKIFQSHFLDESEKKFVVDLINYQNTDLLACL